jgi:cell division protease FtsH
MNSPNNAPNAGGPNPNPKPPLSIFHLLLLFWGMFLIVNFFFAANQGTRIPYSEFMTALDEGRVKEVVITNNQIHGSFVAKEGGEPEDFVTTRVDPELAALLEAKGVEFSRTVESTFFRDILFWVIPALLFFMMILFFLRRMQGGMPGGLGSLGKSKAKVYVEQDIRTRFSDVAGVDEAKEELKEVVGFLRSPKDFGRLGATIPKGLLLVGPPGTGKTLLAKAVAGEAGVPFFSISGSEFVEMLVGLGAARVRDLFETARTKAPCIIFIDELDALGRSRNNELQGGNSEKEQTLNQLLVELDGFDSRTGIVLLAATNRPETLDPALLRAGRFDRQVLVGRPDRRDRLDILQVHVKKIKMDESVDLQQVANLTPGFTGADLANLVNEAAVVATRRGAEKVMMSDFTVAFERIIAGLEKRNRLMNPREREVVAYHEMGHAIVASVVPGADPVHKISIIPRSIGALGYTLQRPDEEKYITTEDELRNRIAVLLGGRAAEIVSFGHLSTGASDDLIKATGIARSMVTLYGMDRHLGHVAYEKNSQTMLGDDDSSSIFAKQRYSNETAREIDQSVKDMIEGQLERAVELLETNHFVLEEASRMLLEKETLERSDLDTLFAQLKDPRAHQGLGSFRTARRADPLSLQ